jgi:hypothetical protein
MADKIFSLKDVKNEVLVKEIRQKFLLEAETNQNLYHTIDIERCRSEDWQIERFIIDKGTPDEAFKALVSAMQWKKSSGIHERTDKYFPRELPLIFGNLKPSRDKQGQVVVWANSVKYRKIPELNFLFENYNAFLMESVDRIAGNMGYISVSDMTGASITSVDMTMAKNAMSLLDYYPLLINVGITVNMAWYFTTFWNVLKTFLPKRIKDRFVFIKKEELKNHIDIDDNELPDSYGGKAPTVYSITDDMLPLRQCKHLGLSDKQIENFYNVYNSI